MSNSGVSQWVVHLFTLESLLATDLLHALLHNYYDQETNWCSMIWGYSHQVVGARDPSSVKISRGFSSVGHTFSWKEPATIHRPLTSGSYNLKELILTQYHGFFKDQRTGQRIYPELMGLRWFFHKSCQFFEFFQKTTQNQRFFDPGKFQKTGSGGYNKSSIKI